MKFLIAIPLLALTGCATFQRLTAGRPPPAVTIATTDEAKVRGFLIQDLRARGYILLFQTPNSVVMTKPEFQDFDRPTWAEDPIAPVMRTETFTFEPDAASIRIVATGTVSFPPGFQSPITNNRIYNDFEGWFDDLPRQLGVAITPATVN